MAQLLLPHFALGLGIGVIDAALVPLLATFVDATLAQEDQGEGSSSMSSYGTVYAIQQTSVSLAYCLGKWILVFFFFLKKKVYFYHLYSSPDWRGVGPDLWICLADAHCRHFQYDLWPNIGLLASEIRSKGINIFYIFRLSRHYLYVFFFLTGP